MKNKRMTYVLVVAVLIVWGIIAYRILSGLDHNDEYIADHNKTFVKEKYDDYAMSKDTSHLLLNYRDPFGLSAPPDTIPKTKEKIFIALSKSPKANFNWNFIKYCGFVRNPGTKKLIAILTINGKNTMLAEGETAENVKLLKNFKDSVMIVFNKQTKFITMNTVSL